MANASNINRAYYGASSAGRDDYWRKMAAPRFRVETILGLLSELRPQRIVDLGCGGGQLLAAIHDRYPAIELTGVDLSTTQIEANRLAAPYAAWMVFDLATPETVPSALSERFDVIIASELVEHVDDPVLLLRNALRLARPGEGRLLLSTQSGPVRETERRVGHVRHFDIAEMEALLREAGWKPVRTWNAGFPFHDMSKWYANRNPDRSMRQFGGDAYGWSQNLVCYALRAAFRFNSTRRGAQLFAVAR